MSGRVDVLFSVIHQREVAFLTAVAARLARIGLRAGFVAFHDGASDMIGSAGFPVVSVHRLRCVATGLGARRARLASLPSVDALLPDLASRVRHERLVFARPEERLVMKALDYEAILSDALERWGRPAVVQELSGFIAPLALYVAARRLGLRHLFIEPAMFARRVVFTENTLEARMLLDEEPRPRPDNVDPARAYVRSYLDSRTVLIPVKDQQFFVDMTRRNLLTRENFRKLARKLAHKYVMGVPEEYDAIAEYVRRHVVKLVRRKLLDRVYERPVPGERFVYFPFHVPFDVQLTLRSPEYLDQEGFAGRLAAALPAGVRLYVKEHPASIGAHKIGRLRALLASGRVRLIHPATNSFELVRNALAVVTINSKVGAEALMQKRPVVVVGKAFYGGQGVTVDVGGPKELATGLSAAMARQPDGVAIDRFLGRVWAWSRPGELFDTASENVDLFAGSLISALDSRAAVGGR